jgi:hypothetical protein
MSTGIKSVLKLYKYLNIDFTNTVNHADVQT